MHLPAAGCGSKARQQADTQLAVEKRKKGKVVTVIRGLTAADNDLPTLLTGLKNSCGAGGSLHEGELEIQGEHLERLREVLGKLGYRVKG